MKAWFFTLFFIPLFCFGSAEKNQQPDPVENASPFMQWLDGPYATGNWWGGRSYLRKHGVDIQSTITYDNTWDLRGGLKRGRVSQFLFDVNMTLNSDLLMYYHGGTFYFDYQVYHGNSPTKKLVGSFAFVDDQLEAFPLTSFNRFSQIWVRQYLMEDRIWFKFGKSDAAAVFENSIYGTYFLNANFYDVPTLLYFPTYPFPAMSFTGAFSPVDWITIKAGLFDGSLAEGYDTGNSIIGRFFDNLFNHAFVIGELELFWTVGQGYKGRMGLGGWYNTSTFLRLNGDTQEGSGGPYFFLDQVLWREGDQDRLGVFVIFGEADPKVSYIQRTIGVGGVLFGVIPQRPKDNMGFAVGHSKVSHSPGANTTKNFEMSIESFYQLSAWQWLTILSDWQYIIHPGGQDLSNAWVTTLRLQINI